MTNQLNYNAKQFDDCQTGNANLRSSLIAIAIVGLTFTWSPIVSAQISCATANSPLNIVEVADWMPLVENYRAQVDANAFPHQGAQNAAARGLLQVLFDATPEQRVRVLFELFPGNDRLAGHLDFTETKSVNFTFNLLTKLEQFGTPANQVLEKVVQRIQSQSDGIVHIVSKSGAGDSKEIAHNHLQKINDFWTKSFPHDGARNAAARELIAPYAGLTFKGKTHFLMRALKIDEQSARRILMHIDMSSGGNTNYVFGLVERLERTGQGKVDVFLKYVQSELQATVDGKPSDLRTWMDLPAVL